MSIPLGKLESRVVKNTQLCLDKVMQPFISKHQLAGRDYVAKGLHGVLFYFFPVGEMPVLPMKHQYSEFYPLTLFFVSNNLVEWQWDGGRMLTIGQNFIQHILANPLDLEPFIQKWVSLRQDFLLTCDGLTSAFLQPLSDQALMDKFYQVYNAYLEQYGIAIGIQDPFSMRSDVLWQPRFKQLLGEKFTDIFPKLTAPSEQSFVEQEAESFLRIIDFAQKHPEDSAKPEIRHLLEQHAANYFFMNNNYAVVEELTAEYYQKKLDVALSKHVQAEQELKHKEQARRASLKLKEQLITQHHIPEEEQIILHITDRFTWQQDERKKTMMIANHYFRLFLLEICHRTGLPEDQLKHSYIHELKDVLLNGLRLPEEWKKRQEFVAVVNTEQGYDLASSLEAKSVHDELFSHDTQGQKQVKGMIACKGKARGRVKIVLKRHDIVNMPQGAVLVASMTRPEMVPAMQRAVAIVTDEGGVTSHAAIISRELNTPCVIGTKLATKLFRDGDLVEVDAETGVVTLKEAAV